MDEYIKREDAMSHPFANGNYDHENANINFILGHESYKEWLETLPAADVRENVHSEWVSVCGLYHCKNCGCIAPYDVEGDVIMYWPELNYCPRCGADMRGVK